MAVCDMLLAEGKEKKSFPSAIGAGWRRPSDVLRKPPEIPAPPVSGAEPGFPGGPVFPADPRLGPVFYPVSKNRALPDSAGFAGRPVFSAGARFRPGFPRFSPGFFPGF